MRTHFFTPLFLLAAVTLGCARCTADDAEITDIDDTDIVVDVDPDLFLSASTTVTTVACTLSDGTTTTCYQIVSKSTPSDHQVGPWCPDNISDGAEAGGIWLEGGEVYDVDGAFIAGLATFYNDTKWKMYDANGDIYTTDTKEECAAAANPNVGAEYANFCVECLPSYVSDITQTYLLPVTPVRKTTSTSFGTGPMSSGPAVRGLAFNGIRYDAPAPTDAILGAYTLAPFDDAGGHINLNAGYHYHAATGLSTNVAQTDGHAPQIGYAIDGHPLHAQLNTDGNEPTDLDGCRGHYDDLRGYHYHVAAPGTNSFLSCIAGAYAR